MKDSKGIELVPGSRIRRYASLPGLTGKVQGFVESDLGLLCIIIWESFPNVASCYEAYQVAQWEVV